MSSTQCPPLPSLLYRTTQTQHMLIRPSGSLCVRACVCVSPGDGDFNSATWFTSDLTSLLHEYCTHTHAAMHVSKCVLITVISIFMIIASLLLFVRSINLHLPPADWQLNLAGHRRAPRHWCTRIVDARLYTERLNNRGTLSRTPAGVHTSIMIGIPPCGCNHRRLSSRAVWGAAQHHLCSAEASHPQPASSSWAIGGNWHPSIRVHPVSLLLLHACMHQFAYLSP